MTKKRIAFIGGGLASLHMAYLLRSEEVDITIYEERDRLGGKIQTVQGPDGFLHELGACYLAPSYPNVYSLFEQLGCHVDPYLRPVPGREMHHKNELKEFGDWALEESRLHLPKICQFLPGPILKIFFLVTLLFKLKKYLRVHKEILGSYKDFMPPPIKDLQRREQLSVPFLDFLKLHKLEMLIPIFRLFQTAQGYGYLESIPTFYGLVWCNPNTIHMIKQQILGKVTRGGTKTNAYLLSTCFESLIRLLSGQIRASIKLSSKVTRVQRTSHGVQVRVNNQEENYDLLVVACPPTALQGILDFTPEEHELFRDLDEGFRFASYLIECEVPSPRKGIITYPSALQPHKSTVVMTLRHSKHFFPENSNPSKLFVSYCYDLPIHSSTAAWEEACLHALQQALPEGRFVIHAKGPTTGNESLYFPHFNANGILEGAPWKLLELQGKNQTLFIGGSSIFESINAIIDYNDLLISNGTIQKWLKNPVSSTGSKRSHPL